MRTTVVPAQITTVEDKITGNLTFAQVMLLGMPLITASVTYLWVPPLKHVSDLKLGMMLVQVGSFGILSLRLQGRLVIDWLGVYARYYLRPRIYIFTKNDPSRLPVEPVAKVVREESPVMTPARAPRVRLTLSELDQLEYLITSNSLTLRLRPNKKGLDVQLAKS